MKSLIKQKLNIPKRLINALIFVIIIAGLMTVSIMSQESYQQKLSPLITDKNQAGAISQSGLSLMDHMIYSSPNTKNIQAIVEDIDQAKKEIKMMIYILSEREIKDALKRAHSRGVMVEVILENETFGSDVLSVKTHKELTEAGIKVIDPDHDRYTFTHAKMIIIDDIYYISTGNLSYSSFKDNKEFFIRGTNHDIHAYLSDLFLADRDHRPWDEDHDGIWLSPINSRSNIEHALKNAQSSILLMMQTVSDNTIEDILEEQAKNGRKIQLCLGDLKKVASNETIVKRLSKYDNVEIYAPKRPYIHAKSLIVDANDWYIGSINFTTNSFDNNREIGLHFHLTASEYNMREKDFLDTCSGSSITKNRP